MAHFEKQLSHEKVFEGIVIDVYHDRVELENGRKTNREIVSYAGGVAMLAREGDKLFFVRQYRYPVKAELLEIPAGKLDRDEEPYHAALREMKEETGLVPGRVVELGPIWSSPGCYAERLHLYYMDDLKQESQELDPGEFLTVEKIAISDIRAMVARGEIEDAKTLSALAMADARGLLD